MPVPISLGVQAKSTSKKTHAYRVSGTVTEGGTAVPGLKLSILRGSSATRLVKVGSATTSPSGTYSAAGKLKAKGTTYFQVTGSVGERDYTATGCASPLTPFAPAGCVNATLSRWTAKSVVVKLNT